MNALGMLQAFSFILLNFSQVASIKKYQQDDKKPHYHLLPKAE